ncbi:MAG: tRNA (N6-isopentenyl adenosine(37)-C2)-methylthiotransferase MiaB, partial [Planctomycetes bacterium]|nr:tRNA (N6-isopentenyl adenosine(37)-C2)-methylthiotransferase MiaB [Planctomycetota bacterium]
GCQMNKLDSETAAEMLLAAGFDAAVGPDDADVILFNTCSVREHAEERVYSRVGALKLQKQRRPELIIGVMGCMAQKDGERVFRRAPLVDIVCGPKQESNLARLIGRAREGRRILALDNGSRIKTRQKPPGNVHLTAPIEPPPFARSGITRPAPFKDFVAITLGCNNFCSYCIVPCVRGPEESRPADEIADEIKRLADSGVREITLLGQNVNSYAGGLPRLLQRIHNTPGLQRIRFVTSHPKDVTDDLLQAMAELPKVCEYLHAPAQSGSTSVLHRMNRGYTREHYDDMLERARRIVPGIEIAGDFIVGFPGETEEDFHETVDLVRTAGFNQCFIFKYSPRPGTRAAELPDDVPDEVKKRRNGELLAVQEEVSARRNRDKHGRVLEVLTEGPSKNDASKLAGRSRGYDIVITEGAASLAGRTVPVRITESTPLTLFGEIVE